jgi:hypothetical protein
MTDDQVIEIAIQGHASTRDAIRYAIEHERRRCLEICKSFEAEELNRTYTAQDIAHDIRYGHPTKLLSDSQLDKLIISEWGQDVCLPAMRRFARVVEKAVKNN